MSPETKFTLGYVWLISVFGSIFLGGEIALMRTDKEIEAQKRKIASDLNQCQLDRVAERHRANTKLLQCNRIITGGMR
jgi:hypothetical protein